MRPAHAQSLPAPQQTLHVWQTLAALFPYLWQYKGRVVLAMVCLIGAKLASVSVPLVFKDIIDAFSQPKQGDLNILILPVMALLLYGGLRLAGSLLTEFRELLFARVTLRAVRHVSLAVFNHLHSLSLRFHLDRQTGGISRDVERGSRSISSLISYTLYSILPTLVEIGLVLTILLVQYDAVFALITLSSLVAYIVFTVVVSGRRIAIRRVVNETDSAANSRAIDALLNYETVKYFNNEAYEARRYDENLVRWEEASVKSQRSLAFLNIGQQLIIVTGVTLMMWRAAEGVVAGTMTVGDLVLVNAFLIQLYMPLNFLGVVYREIRQAITDIERMFNLLNEHREIADAPQATAFADDFAPRTGNLAAPEIRFNHVHFAYDAKRPILQGLSFTIPAGKTIAVVGHSGAGKSTLARLLFRFYDVTAGSIEVAGRDIRSLQQDSLRRAIGIVPQDTVLFNDSILFNIRYGSPDASDAEVESAARAAQLHDFILTLPDGYQTKVGERGLKLSGGEKQRVAIARTLLKNPPILIFDEATSALDSHTEMAIQQQIEYAAQGRTTLIIAHRLSTIMNADEILVLDQGRLVERGSHTALLAAQGSYAILWSMQQEGIAPGSSNSQ